MQDAGVAVQAISVESKAATMAGVMRDALPFPVLLDPEFTLIDALGLRHRDAGPGGSDVPFATSCLIDRDGIVRERFAPENWRVRATPEEILAAARALR